MDGSIPSTQKSAVDQYISTICKEYKTTITSTSYEQTINKYIEKAKKYINIAN